MDSFPIETLKNMEQQLQNKQENLISLSEGILRSIEEKLSNHDGYAVNELRKKLKKINIYGRILCILKQTT